MTGSNSGCVWTRWGIAALGLAVTLVPLLACGNGPAIPLSELTAEDWDADTDWVVDILTSVHPDPFGYHDIDPARFEEQVAELRRIARSGVTEDVLLGMDRLVATVGDGHTSLDAVQSRAGMNRLPLGAQYFGDELWVIAAAADQGPTPGSEAFLGARILAFDGVPTEEVLDRVSELISRDNTQELVYFGPTYMVTPAALRFVGIQGAPDTVVLTLRRDGQAFDFPVAAWSGDRIAAAEWSYARDPDVQPPLSLRRPEETYWFKYLPEEGAVYVNWDRINNADDGPSLRRFYSNLFDLIDREDVERLVVDLRQNNGGNFHRADRFIEEVLERPWLTGPGALYVLTAPRTFSAATHTASRLKFRAGATVVGDPSRGNPNFSYNAETEALPRSGLFMEYTDRLHESPPFPELGELRYLPVDIPAHNTFQDYLAGRDRVLGAALAEPGGS